MLSTICLAAVIYFEARSEPPDAQAAVAGVVLERVESSRYPDNICSVALQHKQFSAFNNGFHPIKESRSWRTAMLIAKTVLDDPGVAPIQHATHYHTMEVRPYWADEFSYLGQSGAHLFYAE